MPFWKHSKKTTIPPNVKALIEKRHQNQLNGKIQTVDTELIVDDNQVNRDVLNRYLKKYNYNSMQCGNGLETLECCTDTNYKIIWIDLKMPIMCGLEAVRYLRAEYPEGFGYKGFIVGVTGYADDESRQECLESGMNTVLTKPYVGEHLYRLHNHACFSVA